VECAREHSVCESLEFLLILMRPVEVLFESLKFITLSRGPRNKDATGAAE